MFVSMSVEIDAAPEEVWPHLVDPEKCKAWFTALDEYTWTSEVGGVGSTFHWEETANGRQYSLDFETTEWVPNRVFAYTMTKGTFFASYDERWVIEPTATGSRFTFNDHIEFPWGPLGKVIGWFGARGARKTGTEVLARLKHNVESARV